MEIIQRTGYLNLVSLVFKSKCLHSDKDKTGCHWVMSMMSLVATCVCQYSLLRSTKATSTTASGMWASDTDPECEEIVILRHLLAGFTLV